MYRTTDCCKEYINGNITIKFDDEHLELAKTDKNLALSDALDWIDCYFFGDTYCLSNWTTGHSIYNCHSDLVYVFDWSLLDVLLSGKTVRLYARKPDDADRELLEKEGY